MLQSSSGNAVTDVLPPRTSNDYIAASIFWLYILGALYFSAVTLYTIISLQPDERLKNSAWRRDNWLLSLAAGVSFTVLSVNMLNILIQSYISWYDLGTVTWRTAVRWLPNTWIWSLETKPFVKFIDDILTKPAAARWTVIALLATFAMHVYMSVEGKRHSIPRMWAFFGLAQILPISFSSTLFFLAVLRSPRATSEARIPLSGKLLPAFAFWICLEIAGYLVQPQAGSRPDEGRQWVVPLIVFARVLLLVPPFMVRRTRLNRANPRDPLTRPASIARGAVIGFFALQFMSGRSWNESSSFYGLTENPAVSTLGCDLILLVIDCQVWAWIQRSGEGRAVKAD